MATGFEAAGLALGLFPLVIEGIEIYISSAAKIIEIMHHRRTLDEFRRELGIEKGIFDNIWYTLATRADVNIVPNVELSSETMKEVLSFLNPDAVKHFVDACQELGTILGELAKKFQKYEQNLVGLEYNLARLYY